MIQNEKISSRSVQLNLSILDAMKKMDEVKTKMLFVFDGSNFRSILTIGDIQRAIIRNVQVCSPVSDILDTDKKFAKATDSIEDIKKRMTSMRAECMPVVNDNGNLVDVIFWSEIMEDDGRNQRGKIDIPVVIMAGGKGTRLKPLTNIIPKPLVPIGEKTIVEEILDKFEEIGCKRFFMSVNYKAEMLKFYLTHLDHKYDIEFFLEDKPLGTIGSVKLLKEKIDSPFFVSNCDILIDQDYRDVYNYHIENHNDITLITAIKGYKIPYGVIKAGEDGLMMKLEEKPETSYMLNTGVYILNPALIDEIPSDEIFHITDLINKVKQRGGRIGCFPISENAWRDMGEWPEYLKLINVL